MKKFTYSALMLAAFAAGMTLTSAKVFAAEPPCPTVITDSGIIKAIAACDAAGGTAEVIEVCKAKAKAAAPAVKPAN